MNQIHPTNTNANKLRKIMQNQANWVGLVGRFGYEQALSDYIALYPHRLEDGLMPYPEDDVREKSFPDLSRLDVLLLDKYEKPVIVECKRESPCVEDVEQLQGYIRKSVKVIGNRDLEFSAWRGQKGGQRSYERAKKLRIEIIAIQA